MNQLACGDYICKATTLTESQWDSITTSEPRVKRESQERSAQGHRTRIVKHVLEGLAQTKLNTPRTSKSIHVNYHDPSLRSKIYKTERIHPESRRVPLECDLIYRGKNRLKYLESHTQITLPGQRITPHNLESSRSPLPRA